MSKKAPMSEYSQLIYTTVTPAIGGLVIILNLLELFAIYKFTKKSRKKLVSFIYISSLSASDVMVGIVMIILKSMDPFMKTTLKRDAAAKEIYGILKHVFVRLSLFTSIFNLMALTFDRFMAIKYPLMHRKMGKSFAIKICILVWVLSLGCVTFVYCITRFHVGNVDRYNNLVFPISSYTALVSFIVAYTTIFLAIRQSNQNTLDAANGSCSSKRKISVGDSNGEKQQSKKEMKFLKLAVVTVVVFCLCWLPFSTCNLLKASGISCGGKDVERTLFTLAFTNSLLNPFVYFAHIRKRFKSITNNLSRLLGILKKSDRTPTQDPEINGDYEQRSKSTSFTSIGTNVSDISQPPNLLNKLPTVPEDSSQDDSYKTRNHKEAYQTIPLDRF